MNYIDINRDHKMNIALAIKYSLLALLVGTNWFNAEFMIIKYTFIISIIIITIFYFKNAKKLNNNLTIWINIYFNIAILLLYYFLLVESSIITLYLFSLVNVDLFLQFWTFDLNFRKRK